MLDELTILGLRVLDIPEFSWRPGMKTLSGDRVIAVKGSKIYLDSIYPTEEVVHTYYLLPKEVDDLPDFPHGDHYEGRSFTYKQLTGEIPDLSDGATRGALVEILRTVYNSNNAHISWDRGWSLDGVIDSNGPVFLKSCPTEAEALVYSLEAANR